MGARTGDFAILESRDSFDGEMRIDLKALIQDGRIGRIALGSNAGDVINDFGIPSWWEGKENFSYQKSQIWLYGPLQVNLNNVNAVEVLQFNVGGDSDYPMEYNGVTIDDIDQITKFREFLNRENIQFSESNDAAGKLTISVPEGALSKFSTVSSQDPSLEVHYLVSIRVEGA